MNWPFFGLVCRGDSWYAQGLFPKWPSIVLSFLLCDLIFWLSLSCMHPLKTSTSLNKEVWLARGLVGRGPPDPTLKSALPSPPQGWIWHRSRVKSGNRCRINVESMPNRSLRMGGRGDIEGGVRGVRAFKSLTIGDFLRGGIGRGGIPHPGERYNVCPQWCRDTQTVTRVRHHLLC